MEFFRAADGLQLAYRDEGPHDALPVLCLAGLTRNSSDFDYLAPHLRDVRLIRPDYRGRGASEWAADWNSYSVLQETQDTLALLDHLGIDRVAIIGTSRGGLIAMTIAAMARNRLIGVVLNDIGTVIEPRGLEVIRDYVGIRPTPATHRALAEVKSRLPGFANVPMSRWIEEAERQAIEVEDGLNLTYDPALRHAVLAAEGQTLPDLWPFFEALRGLPVALIRGANSDLLSLSTAQEMCRRMPEMTFADIPDRAHVPFLDEPKALAAIQDWISRCRSTLRT